MDKIKWGEDKAIKLAKYGEREAWFSVETNEGGICHRPYDKMSVKELIQLRQAIDDMVRELTIDM